MCTKEIPYSSILVVDDSEVDFFIATTILKGNNPSAQVGFAMDVNGGLNMLKNSALEKLPDLILLDMHFERQEKQGPDFLNEFKTLRSTFKKEIRIIVLTAFVGFIDYKQFAKDFPDTSILKKPLSLEKILSVSPFRQSA